MPRTIAPRDRKFVDGRVFKSVETPSVFREYSFPCDHDDWTAANRANMAKLYTLAETHCVAIITSSYRRG